MISLSPHQQLHAASGWLVRNMIIIKTYYILYFYTLLQSFHKLDPSNRP